MMLVLPLHLDLGRIVADDILTLVLPFAVRSLSLRRDPLLHYHRRTRVKGASGR